MKMIQYAIWGLLRLRGRYRPVYLSVSLMSGLVFLSIILLPSSTAQSEILSQGSFKANHIADAPVLVLLMGACVGISQVLLVIMRIQKTREPEYNLLGLIGYSKAQRVLLSVAETAAHLVIGSLSGVLIAACGALIWVLNHHSLSAIEVRYMLTSCFVAIGLPLVVCLPVCALLVAQRASFRKEY